MDYDVVRTNVKNAYKTYGSSDKNSFNKNMSEFYTVGKQNPSVAHMILVDQLRKEGLKQSQANEQHLKTFKDNFKVDIEYFIPFADKTPIIERQSKRDAAKLEMCLGTQKVLKANETQMSDLLSEEVKPIKEGFDTVYKAMYPRTYHIRKRLIEKFGFSMYKTAPKRPYNEKIQLAEPNNGWRAIYPNTYETRIRLLSMNRLGKNGVVSILKKMFWNTSIVKHFDLKKAVFRVSV